MENIHHKYSGEIKSSEIKFDLDVAYLTFLELVIVEIISKITYTCYSYDAKGCTAPLTGKSVAS